MRGVKTDFSMYSRDFLLQVYDDAQDIFHKSGLIKAGNIKFKTFLKELEKEIKRKERSRL